MKKMVVKKLFQRVYPTFHLDNSNLFCLQFCCNQKAKFLWHAIHAVDALPTELSPRELRDYLTGVPGIGPKTASWIVRNHLDCDEVAILDIHILRAGAAIGIFESSADPSREYYQLEERFLQFCDAIDEPASLVDALMWDYMRRIGPTTAVMSKPRQAELPLCL